MTKRVYEKPVFIAQTYVTASSIASNCDLHMGDPKTPLELTKGMNICGGDKGHVLGGHGQGAPVNNYWGYATTDNTGDSLADKTAYLFDSGNVKCDFVWNGSTVSGWTTEQGGNTLQSDVSGRRVGWLWSFGYGYVDFFGGPRPQNDNHRPAYGESNFFS